MAPRLVVCGAGWSVLGEARGPRLWVQHGPGPANLPATRAWLRRGCSGPAPIRQGFAAVLCEPDGSVRAAVSSRLETCLLYAVQAGQLLIGYHPRDVLLSLDALPPLNIQKLTDLVALYDDPRTTVYEGVDRVPIGHHLTWHPGRSTPTVTRWFDPTQMEPLTIKPSDAPALMRETIRDAVAASLPASGDVAATLSGGLDSSMVVATAASILHPQGRTVHCATHRPLPGTPDPGPNWEADDGPYAERMCREVPGLTWRGMVNDDGITPTAALAANFPLTWHPSLNPANTVWIDQILRWTSEQGSSLLLTGATGNAPFSRDRSGAVRQLAVEHRYLALVRDLRRRHLDGESWPRAARGIAGAAFPSLANRVRPGTSPSAGPRFLDLMPIRHQGLSDAARTHLSALHAPYRTHQNWVDFVLRDASTATIGQLHDDTVWWSDPLSDPAVETIALRLPHEAWLIGSGNRSLARQAMSGLVPDHIRLRTSRGAQAADAASGPSTEIQDPDVRPLVGALRASSLCREVLDLDMLETSSINAKQVGAPLWANTIVRALGFGAFIVWYESLPAKICG